MWQGIIGTLPGWLTAAGMAALLTVVFRFLNDRRKIIAENRKVGADARRMETETDDIRIASLERQINRLDQRVELLETEVEDCHKDRDLALAAARFLFDRLRQAAPDDEALSKLEGYLTIPPLYVTPKDMQKSIDELDGKGNK